MGHCELDRNAERSYRALFDTKGEWYCEDIRNAEPEQLPEFDLLCGGFPCQSFSVAGHRGGFSDPRGTLFFELARLAEARKPAYLLFENVPGLLYHDRGRTFAAILHELEGMGYGRKKLLARGNRREGACNRTGEPSVTFCGEERQSVRRATRTRRDETAGILASPSQEKGCTLSDILMRDVEEKYFLSQKQLERLLNKSVPVRREKESTPAKE